MNHRDLPVLRRVQLRNFSLYAHQRALDIELAEGVFCLAGANGLGKSSFLAAINFAYTGIVASPTRTFRGVKVYYEDSQRYSETFFDGRIEQEDRSLAEVSLDFQVGRHSYSLTRNLFQPEALTALKIEDDEGRSLLSSDSRSDRERHQAYAARITEDCRLGAFEYFVFAQHFLLTFDERRHLLFWDPKSADPALYLAFGLQPDDIVEAERIRLASEAEESNARNSQWQATIARNRLTQLGGGDSELTRQLRAERDELAARAEEAADEADQANAAVDDALLKVAEVSAREQSLRNRYNQVFSLRLDSRSDPSLHPAVARLLSDKGCEVCGQTNDQQSTHVRAILDSGQCPLCLSTVEVKERGPDFSELESLDAELAQAQETSGLAHSRLRRVQEESIERARRAAAMAEDLAGFEAKNSEQLPDFSFAGDSTEQRAALELEYRSAVDRRDEHRVKRDRLREQLIPLQERLTSAYQDAELVFVPLFRRLAKRFIGLDLDVFLERRQGSYRLSLEVQGARRRTVTMLSESQRFFLEIALRMALIQHTTGEGNSASFLVDTPEGSLDIAYEARAGDMFADFVKSGYNMVMTANINASQLLVRLAERCGSDKMQLLRMTEWTPLSEVQAEEEELFDEAYARIETKLAASPMGRD